MQEDHENDVNVDGNEAALEEMQESSDSEAEIELSTYEKRRERNAWLTVLAEKLFAETKKRIYHEKKNLVRFYNLSHSFGKLRNSTGDE